MSATTEILIAGFGGQGVLFTGKLLAYCAMAEGKELSWLPSYGPEMRGGTSNCSVCISDEPIGSPLVLEPDLLIAMNQPSYDKFIHRVKPGGKVFLDATRIEETAQRSDISSYAIPATQMESDHALAKGANMFLLGKLLKETGLFSMETVRHALESNTPAKRAHTIENNLKAIQLGAEA